MNNALVPMQDMQRMAESIAKSGLFGMKTPDQALALMVVAQSEGRHPGSIASEYHIIQGRPALKADAMLARFQQSGGSVKWGEYTDARVEATFTHPQGGSVTVDWDMARAHAAKLTGKDNWKSYPRAMLRSRVISEGVRTCYPAVCVGIYTVEEVQDFSPEKDITPTAGVLGALPAATQEAVIETAQQVKAMLANDQAQDAYALWQDSRFGADEEVAFWSQLDSKQRSALKRMDESAKASDKGAISPAAKKRLEARIKEAGIDRDAVKRYCADIFKKEHFQDLTREEYEQLDAALGNFALASQATARAQSPQPESPSPVPAPAAPDAAPGQKKAETEAAPPPAPDAAPITETQEIALENALDMGGKTLHNRFRAQMAVKGIKSVAEIPASRYDGLMKWISEQVDKQNAEAT